MTVTLGNRKSILRLIPVITGIVYVTVCYRVAEPAHVEPLTHVLLAFLVLMPIALAVALFEDELLMPPFLFVVGVTLGVLVDALLDTVDRNLFPFEVLWWVILFTPAIAAGTTLGVFLRRRFRKT